MSGERLTLILGAAVVTLLSLAMLGALRMGLSTAELQLRALGL